jgi:hypothetical protein
MTHEDKLMEWFKEHNVDNLNKTLTKQNEPIVIYDLEEFMDGQKMEDDVNVTLSYGMLRKLYNDKNTFEMAYELMRCGAVLEDEVEQ